MQRLVRSLPVEGITKRRGVRIAVILIAIDLNRVTGGGVQMGAPS
jgi:hypothetical protein